MNADGFILFVSGSANMRFISRLPLRPGTHYGRGVYLLVLCLILLLTVFRGIAMELQAPLVFQTYATSNGLF